MILLQWDPSTEELYESTRNTNESRRPNALMRSTKRQRSSTLTSMRLLRTLTASQSTRRKPKIILSPKRSYLMMSMLIHIMSLNQKSSISLTSLFKRQLEPRRRLTKTTVSRRSQSHSIPTLNQSVWSRGRKLKRGWTHTRRGYSNREWRTRSIYRKKE